MTTTTFKLDPINGRKSFNGLCKVIQEDENGKTISKLQSYDTIVAEYNHNVNGITVNGWYSATTATHINAFLVYYGFDKATKAEMEDWNS